MPGIALGLLSGGREEVWADGVADLSTGEPVMPETRFRIASISKPFTATLALTLVQEGALGLDEPLPGLRVPVTLRQALAHTAGLACEWPSPVLPAFGSGDDALIRLAAAEPERLPVEPGELFSYCNVGYWLVGAAVAHLTGRTFEEAMHERVLEPLGLADTSFEPDPETAAGHVPVAADRPEHRVVRTEEYPRTRRPSGGLYSTVADLLRFARHHVGGPGPLTPESRSLMHGLHARRPKYGYGLGWALERRGGRVVGGHAGSVAGYESHLLVAPEETLALVVLTNSARGSALIEHVADDVGLGADAPLPVALSAEDLGSLAGVYAHQDERLRVEVDDEGLRCELSEVDPTTGERTVDSEFVAVPVGGGEFAVLEGPARGARVDVPRPGFLRTSVLWRRVGE